MFVRLRDPEVGYPGDAVEAYQEVLRRHVAVNQVERVAFVVLELMGCVEAEGSFADDTQNQGDGERLHVRLLEELEGGHPVDEVHHEEGAFAILTDVEHADDVRVAEQARDPISTIGSPSCRSRCRRFVTVARTCLS